MTSVSEDRLFKATREQFARRGARLSKSAQELIRELIARGVANVRDEGASSPEIEQALLAFADEVGIAAQKHGPSDEIDEDEIRDMRLDLEGSWTGAAAHFFEPPLPTYDSRVGRVRG